MLALTFLAGLASAAILRALTKMGLFSYYRIFWKPRLFNWNVCYFCLGFWLSGLIVAGVTLALGLEYFHLLLAFPAASVSITFLNFPVLHEND